MASIKLGDMCASGQWGAEALLARINTRGVFSPEVFDTVTSTNDIAKAAAINGAPEGYIAIARQQSAGRGRRGRSFFSPGGTGLYMSLLLRPKIGARDALGITTAAAVAASRACEALAGVQTGIKWVNDIYIGGKKICGILTEASPDQATGGLQWAILGLGINLAEPEAGFPCEIRPIASSLFGRCAPLMAVPCFATAFLDWFWPLYTALPDKGYMHWYQSHSYLDGREIIVHAPSGEYTARAIGVDGDASLIIELPGGERRLLSSGDVSVHARG